MWRPAMWTATGSSRRRCRPIPRPDCCPAISLASRSSLGWTDLDKAFASALKAVRAKTPGDLPRRRHR